MPFLENGIIKSGDVFFVNKMDYQVLFSDSKERLEGVKFSVSMGKNLL